MKTLSHIRTKAKITPFSCLSWILFNLSVTALYFIVSSNNAYAGAATYYVDGTNGNDAYSGTEQYPWKTIQKAADTMQPGDTVNIMAGTYEEQVVPINSGSVGHYITYQAYGNGEVVIKAPNNTDARCIYLPISSKLEYMYFENLSLDNAYIAFQATAGDYETSGTNIIASKTNIIIDNCTITNSMRGVYFSDGVKDSKIINCELSNNQDGIMLGEKNENILIENNIIKDGNFINHVGDHISLSGFTIATMNSNIQIIGNDISKSLRQGILVSGSDKVLVRDNWCHDNDATGIQIEGDWWDATSFVAPSHVVVENNLCEFNAQTEGAETGIWIDDTDFALVQNNIIRCNATGMRISGCFNVIARNNLIYENRGEYYLAPEIIYSSMGICVTGTDSRYLSTGREAGGDNIIVHNTIHRNGHYRPIATPYSQISINYGGVVGLTNTYRTVFKNNIASESLSENPNLDMVIDNDTVDNILDYNNYYNTGSLQIALNGSTYSWNDYLDLENPDHDNNSITSDPLFINPTSITPTSIDLRLRHNSPCIEGGGFLTTAFNSGITSTSLQVNDARYFSDGYGVVAGDLIKVGAADPVTITSVNYVTKAITLTSPISWNQGDNVSYPYEGTRPDIGRRQEHDCTDGMILKCVPDLNTTTTTISGGGTTTTVPGGNTTTTISGGTTTTVPGGNTTTTISRGTTTTIPGTVTTSIVHPGEVGADFIGSPLTGKVPLQVQFTNLSGGDIATYSWNFGDGGVSTEKNPSHVYQKNGTYSVILTVTGVDSSKTAQKERDNHISVKSKCAILTSLDNSSQVESLRTARNASLDDLSGALLTAIYYRNTSEVSALFEENSVLRNRFRQLVTDNSAVLENLLQGQPASVSSAAVADVIGYLEDLKTESSISLQYDIDFVIMGIRSGLLLNGLGITIQ